MTDKVTSITPKLEQRKRETSDYHAHLDRLCIGHRILADAVCTMHESGITKQEIVSLLRFAANELDPQEEDD
jgi:hypothetical protein